MATEEKKKDDEEKKEEEIMKSSGLRWRVSFSIIVSIGWLVFLILWFAFYALDYTVYQNIVITLVSILIMGAILGVSWASWGMKYCWKGENGKGKKEKKWWQLKRIVAGFWVIIFLIAFGIAQPILWRKWIGTDPPAGTMDLSILLTIVIALFALGLTAFSILIYEYIKKKLTADIIKKIQSAEAEIRSAEAEIHEHIKEHVEEVSIRGDELSKRTEEEVKNRQNLFTTKLQRNMGYIFWKLFKVEEKKENNRSTSVLKALIMLAIERTKISLDYARKLPEKEYKEDIYRSKSNWVYFLAEAARVKVFEPTKQDKADALKLTNEILVEVSKQDFYPDDYYEHLENCAWVLQYLSKEKDVVSKQKAHDIIRKVLNDGSITFPTRERIEKKWGHLLEEKNNTSNPIKNV